MKSGGSCDTFPGSFTILILLNNESVHELLIERFGKRTRSPDVGELLAAPVANPNAWLSTPSATRAGEGRLTALSTRKKPGSLICRGPSNEVGSEDAGRLLRRHLPLRCFDARWHFARAERPLKCLDRDSPGFGVRRSMAPRRSRHPAVHPMLEIREPKWMTAPALKYRDTHTRLPDHSVAWSAHPLSPAKRGRAFPFAEGREHGATTAFPLSHSKYLPARRTRAE